MAAKGIPESAFAMTCTYKRVLIRPMIRDIMEKGTDYEKDVLAFYVGVRDAERDAERVENYFSGIQALHASLVSRQYEKFGQADFEARIIDHYENMIKRYVVGL